MNPRVALLLILVAVLAAVLVVWWFTRQAGVRRRDFNRVRAERDLAVRALNGIEAKTDLYRDLESVLATDVRLILRDYTTKRMELDR
jgi:hypothetical protein